MELVKKHNASQGPKPTTARVHSLGIEQGKWNDVTKIDSVGRWIRHEQDAACDTGIALEDGDAEMPALGDGRVEDSSDDQDASSASGSQAQEDAASASGFQALRTVWGSDAKKWALIAFETEDIIPLQERPTSDSGRGCARRWWRRV